MNWYKTSQFQQYTLSKEALNWKAILGPSLAFLIPLIMYLGLQPNEVQTIVQQNNNDPVAIKRQLDQMAQTVQNKPKLVPTLTQPSKTSPNQPGLATKQNVEQSDEDEASNGKMHQKVDKNHKIAWGDKVSPEFKAKVIEISGELDISPDWLMACMAFETGRTFDPAVRNMAGSSGTGLIQFMSQTANNLGTTTRQLSRMTDVQQLDYVRDYLAPYAGKMKGLEDVYMAILYPAAVGKPWKYVLFRKGTLAYTQNRGLDTGGKGYITKFDASRKIRSILSEGYSRHRG